MLSPTGISPSQCSHFTGATPHISSASRKSPKNYRRSHAKVNAEHEHKVGTTSQLIRPALHVVTLVAAQGESKIDFHNFTVKCRSAVNDYNLIAYHCFELIVGIKDMMLYSLLFNATGALLSCRAAEVAEKYVPGPVELGPEIWAGTIAATIPFVIGSWEFGKRIVSQHPSCRHFQSKRSSLASLHHKSKASLIMIRSFSGDARHAVGVD